MKNEPKEIVVDVFGYKQVLAKLTPGGDIKITEQEWGDVQGNVAQLINRASVLITRDALNQIYEVWGKKSKGDIFVEHIQSHLKPGQEVICKICNKTVDEIYQELKSEKEQSNKGDKK